MRLRLSAILKSPAEIAHYASSHKITDSFSLISCEAGESEGVEPVFGGALHPQPGAVADTDSFMRRVDAGAVSDEHVELPKPTPIHI